MKIQLCMPEQEYREICSEGWTVPLGILTIGTYLRNREHDIEVIANVSHSEMIQKVGSDIVGFSTTLGNYRNALELAREAKRKNPDSRVVLGGPEASYLYREILNNRGPNSNDYCIDTIFCGDAVEAFYKFVSGSPLNMIHNLAYVEDGKIKTTARERENPENWPIPYRGFLNMESAFQRYVEKFGEQTPFRRATNIMSQYGCTSKWCKFCGRTDRRWVGREPEIVWDELTYLVKTYWIDYVFDFSDSFVQRIDYIREFLRAKPSNVNPAFRFFARADQIAPESVDLMKRFGAYEVYIGLESGDQRMLDNMNKGTTVEQNLNAAKLIADRDIRLIAALVLGAEGEDETSLQNTLRHVEEVSRIVDLEGLLCSTWIPLPGSWSYEHIKDRFEGKDDLDMIELKREWVRRMCKASYDTIQDYTHRILEFAPIKDIKGEEKC